MPNKRETTLWRKPNSNKIWQILWYDRDGRRRKTSTGTRDRRQAEKALAHFIVNRDTPTGPSTPDQVTVNEVLTLYGEHHGPTVKATRRLASAIAAMVPILGSLPVAHINGAVCRRYAKMRNRAPSTVRRDLGVLQAAINWCHGEGYLTAPVKVKLPKAGPPRDRWLSRDEAAKLLRAAYRNPHTKHLARFILVALYTGTRKSALLGLRFMPHVNGGWVDTERGILHRRAVGQAETKKRQPSVPIPARLLSHLRRWERMGADWVVERPGQQRIRSISTAWRSVLAEAGIEHCTRHDLRRTAITWAVQRGMPMFAATGYFGVTSGVLERVYAQHSPDYLREAVAALDNRRRA